MAYTETIRRIYADAGYSYEVRPGDVPGVTDVMYRDEAERTASPDARISVNVDELRQLIAALQARLPEAEVEEANP